MGPCIVIGATLLEDATLLEVSSLCKTLLDVSSLCLGFQGFARGFKILLADATLLEVSRLCYRLQEWREHFSAPRATDGRLPQVESAPPFCGLPPGWRVGQLSLLEKQIIFAKGIYFKQSQC